MTETEELHEEAAALLEATADIIEERGHTKNRLSDGQGRVCLIGGMNIAEGDRHVTSSNRAYEVRFEACRALIEEVGPIDELDTTSSEVPLHRAVYWNNLDETTPTDVIDGCRHAAKRLRGGVS